MSPFTSPQAHQSGVLAAQKFGVQRVRQEKFQSAEADKVLQSTTAEHCQLLLLPFATSHLQVYNFTWRAFLWVSCRTQSKNPNNQNAKALEARHSSVNLQIFNKSINILQMCVGFISTVLSWKKIKKEKEKKCLTEKIRDFPHYNWWTDQLQGISRIMAHGR